MTVKSHLGYTWSICPWEDTVFSYTCMYERMYAWSPRGSDTPLYMTGIVMWSECFDLCIYFFLYLFCLGTGSAPAERLGPWLLSARGTLSSPLLHFSIQRNSSTLNLKSPLWFKKKKNLISVLLMQHIRDSACTDMKVLPSVLRFIIPDWINGFHMSPVVLERQLVEVATKQGSWKMLVPNFHLIAWFSWWMNHFRDCQLTVCVQCFAYIASIWGELVSPQSGVGVPSWTGFRHFEGVSGTVTSDNPGGGCVCVWAEHGKESHLLAHLEEDPREAPLLKSAAGPWDLHFKTSVSQNGVITCARWIFTSSERWSQTNEKAFSAAHITAWSSEALRVGWNVKRGA